MTSFLAIVLVILVIFTLGYFGWRIERWANWRFSYGPQVEKQIKDLEKRIIELEKGE